MLLANLYKNFDSRCKSYDVRLNNIITSKAHIEEWQFNYQTEVLISDIWQNWSRFCRNLVLLSCQGTKARDMSIICKRNQDNSWKRIGYEASMAVKKRPLTTNGHINFKLRLEPTWGDIDAFITIVNTLSPANKNTLTSIFGSFSSLKDLQKVRNACAHKNAETILDLGILRKNYGFTKLKCATDIAWESSIIHSVKAIELWLYEMNLIADYSTSNN